MKKRAPVQYLCLAVLFAIAVAFQARVAWDFFQAKYEGPFHLQTASAVITQAQPAAVKAEIKNGDTLIAVNGKPYLGTAMLADDVTRAGPHGTLTVTVRSQEPNGQNLARTVSIQLQGRGAVGGIWGVTGLVLTVVMPFFCLLLGFWVAAVRPRDPVAWLVLALLLGFTQTGPVSSAGWGPWVRDLGAVYHMGLNSTWPIWMLLVGLYFPEPFPAGRRTRWQSQLGWLIVLLIGLWAIFYDVVLSVASVENYASMSAYHRVLAPYNSVAQVLGIVAIGSFFASIAAKGSMAVSRDAKRRLKFLYVGSSVSFWPIFVLFVLSELTGKSFDQVFPWWLIIAALLLLCLFPLTLAYVIVVERAMDVRVVIRQGLRYAFAKSGVSAGQMIVGAVLIYVVIRVLEHVQLRSVLFFVVIAAAVVVFIRLRRVFKSVRAWTDRKFFRDAYDAEQILTELSEKVRTIVEIAPLLETVSRRIADSLHVPRIAVFLDGSGLYREAYALGYENAPAGDFPAEAGTVVQLGYEMQPARVYLDDANSWVNRAPGLEKEEKAKLAALGTELLLPLAAKDKLLGFISLGQKMSEQPYSASDLRLLKSVAAQTGLALENARLAAAVAEEIAERKKLDREVEIAREVQERLFPQKLPAIQGLDYYGVCRPARGVGGDYYDFLALPEGKLGIAVGDVSGKGISAALMMASLQASLRGEAMRAPDTLTSLISNLNRLVYEATSDNRYATFFYGQYDPSSRQLLFVNAGHNPPMLFRTHRGAGCVERLDASGTVIGLFEHFPYQQAAVTLAPGDRLVVYTDGVSEAMNPGQEEWGEQRMGDALARCDGLCAAETVRRVIAAADHFAAGAQQYDDMTLVVLRVTE